MKKIKHSKYKNTGFLFELLVKQITSDILNNTDNSHAQRIVSEFFSSKSELLKELELYRVLRKRRTPKFDKAASILESVIDFHKKLNHNKLQKEKYSLIREIKKHYDLGDFFRSPVSDYRLLASIYKTFEYSITNEQVNIEDAIDSKTTILESMCTTSNTKEKKDNNDLIIYESQDPEIKSLAFRIFIQKFNEKYKNLNARQKSLLKEYINNISNTNGFREYVNEQVDYIKSRLLKFKVKDKATRIKIHETVNQLDKAKKGKIVKDNQMSALMLSYDLIDELAKYGEN